MKGAVAAGHPRTAEVGAGVLAAGGNAVDACVAAGFASWVAESPLTGPGGGGFMLVHRARDRSTRLLDFFAAVPGLAAGRRRPAPIDAIDVDFAGSTTQRFRIGLGSCAVPGTAAGLEAAHRGYGTLPWRELVAPAIALARDGVALTAEQAWLHEMLDAILRAFEEGRRVYGATRPLAEGERLVLPDLAATLERLAGEGAAAIHGGQLGRAIAAHVPGISLDDLRAYRVIRRRPVRVRYRGHELVSNPPPSSGGILIAYGLALLERLGAESPAALAEVMNEQSRARVLPEFLHRLHRGGLAARLLAAPAVAAGLARVRAGLAGAAEPPALAGTTHVSVVDAEGNAASLSASTGSGSGVIVPGTGISLNNMLGEADLALGPRRPGVRLTSMMAPTIALGADGPSLVVGSAGSARLRGAVLQVIVNTLARGLDPAGAIERHRLHAEDGQVHCEDAADAAELERAGYDVVRWPGRNLYFGGAAAVARLPGGRLAAAGDSRRGGAGVVVA